MFPLVCPCAYALLTHPLTRPPPHRLRLIAPVIRDHGIDYERGKFQDKLANGTLTVERTTVSQPPPSPVSGT
jgi:hypothetical protein